VVEWIDRRSGLLSDGEIGRVAALEGSVRRLKSHPQWGQADVTKDIASPGRTGERGIEGSVNPSRRPARPNRVHHATVSSTRFDSSIADFDSRHRAPFLRRRELGHGAMRGPARRAPRSVPWLKWMWRFFRPKPRLEESPCPLTRVARVEVRHASLLRVRSYPGRMREGSPGEGELHRSAPLGPGGQGRAPPRGSACQRRPWMAFGLQESGERQAAPESGDRPSHAARRNGTKATRVKNEGAFPPADARTYRPEEGSDDDSLMPPRAKERWMGSLD
jgi:hypothetical protein